ncbi:MAG: hypothetical protein RL318_951 [Fibrobacterota bacterium]|jgi:hypothetical protein
MSKASRQLKRTAAHVHTPANASPSLRIEHLLEEIRLLELDISCLEEQRPVLQARLHASVSGLYDQIIAGRKELLRMIERKLAAAPRDRRLQRDGVELLFEIARDLEERFGADVSEFTNRWGDAGNDDEEDSQEDDFAWARTETRTPPPGQSVRRNPGKAALDPEAAAKGIYRSLARELHPDKTREGDDHRQRTELMQALTGAWQERDLGALLRLLHAHGSDDAKAGAMDEESLKVCVQGLEYRHQELAQTLKSLRHRQLPQGVMDWLPLVRDPSLFEKLVRRTKAPAREEIEFLKAVRGWWLRPGGFEECLSDPPQGLC